MLGQPMPMLIPEVIGFRLDGALPEGATATDLVLTVTQLLRKKGVVGQVRRVLRSRPGEPHHRGSRHHRQHGARVRRDLRLLPDRPGDHRIPEGDRPRPRARGAGRGLCQGARPLARGRRARAGVHRHRSSSTWPTSLPPWPAPNVRRIASRSRTRRAPSQRRWAPSSPRPASTARTPVSGEAYDLGDGDVVIAAITSCTNTSNPSVLIAAGLLGQEGARQGAEGEALGQDLARARLAGGHRLPGQGRSAEVAGRTWVQPGRLRLHDLHRQFRAAAAGDLRGRSGRRPGGGQRALRQPQLRGTGQSRHPRQLPGLAAARRRLRAWPAR